MSELKRNEVCVFLDGSLTIKVEGHGEQNGWGQFSWDEQQVEFVPYDEKSGCALNFDIPKSELIELRDFLNRIFPTGGQP